MTNSSENQGTSIGLDCASKQVGAATVLILSGEADINGAEAMQAALTKMLASHPLILIVDVSQLTFLSSLAIGHLVAAIHNVRTRGGTTLLAGPQPNVAETLRKVNVHDLFEIVSTVKAGLAEH